MDEIRHRLYIPKMLRGALALILLATPALAQVTAEPRSIGQSGEDVRVSIILSALADQKVLLTRATLLDSETKAYGLSGEPFGIQIDPKGWCEHGSTTFRAGERHIISATFKAPEAKPPFALIMEFVSPEGSGCRAFSISLDRLDPRT